MRYARSPAHPDPGSRIPDAGSPAHPGGREQGARSKEQGVGSREEAPARYWMLDTRCWIRPPARAREQEAAATRPDARYEMRDPPPVPALSFRVRSPACPRVAEGEAGRATSRGLPRQNQHMEDFRGRPRVVDIGTDQFIIPMHPASSIQHPASSIQHPASSIQHPGSGARGFSPTVLLPSESDRVGWRTWSAR